VGVWVSAGAEELLLPFLFMEAACPNGSTARETVPWQGNGHPPKKLRRTGELSLLHGTCDVDAREETGLHLFASTVGGTAAFERQSTLSDWRLPVPVAGIVLLVNTQGQGGSTGWLSFGHRGWRDRTLSWVKAQGLPYVVAVMDSGLRTHSPEWFQKRLDLPQGLPILVGPYLARQRLLKGSREGAAGGLLRTSMPALLGLGDLTFDPDYAKQILGALCLTMH
jgi:hypothetical protein